MDILVLQTREEMLVSNRLKVEFLAFFNCREVLTVDGEDWANDEEVRLKYMSIHL